MKSVEIQTEAIAADHPHLYELLALQEGVRMFRTATPADLSRFTDTEVMQMIRAICGNGEHFANLADRIEADHRAILRALNTLGLRKHTLADAR